MIKVVPRWSTRNCTDWTSIDFNTEFCLQLCIDDNCRRVWRRSGHREDPALTIVSHTGPQQGTILKGVISFHSRTHLDVISSTVTAQFYDNDIIRQDVIPFLLRYPSFIFDTIEPGRTQYVCYELSSSLPYISLASLFS